MSGFEIVALLMATPVAIEQLITFGKKTSKAIKRLRHPESLPQDLITAFDLPSETRSLENKIAVGRRICQATTHFDAKFREELDADFQAFQAALKAANDLVEKLLQKNIVKQVFSEAKYMRKLTEAVTVLGMRRRSFMDTIDTIHIDDQLPSFAKLDPKHFGVDLAGGPISELTDAIKVFRCHLAAPVRQIQPHQGAFLIELRKYNDDDEEEIQEQRAKNVAETLSTARDDQHILPCVGYCDLSPLKSLGIVFAMPQETANFKSLGDFMRSTQTPMPSLTARINLCKLLAAAVLQVRTLQPAMVHKNINPDNIMLLLSNNQASMDIPEQPLVYLVNWQLSRTADEATTYARVSEWRHKIYQHPSRQVPRQESTYTLDHDIYSLGVCMIELLLWKPFVVLDGTDKPQAKGLIFGNTSYGPIASDKISKLPALEPDTVVDRLRHLAEAEIPPVAGQTLSKLILQCLDGLSKSEDAEDALVVLFAGVIKQPLDRIHV